VICDSGCANLFLLGCIFIMSDLVYCIDRNIITLNGRCVVMTFLFDLMSLLCIGFICFISSFVILFSDDLCLVI
jgi:hypothetical protein